MSHLPMESEKIVYKRCVQERVVGGTLSYRPHADLVETEPILVYQSISLPSSHARPNCNERTTVVFHGHKIHSKDEIKIHDITGSAQGSASAIKRISLMCVFMSVKEP